MSLKKLGIALVAVFAMAAIVANSASAAFTTGHSRWLDSSGNTLTEAPVTCSNVGTFTLLSTIAGSEVELTAGKLACSSNAKIATTGSGASQMAVDSGTLVFSEVTVMKPLGCTVAESTITTEPLSTNLEMEGTAVYDKFVPTSGEKFAVVKIRKCAAEGNYNVTGYIRGRSPNTTGTQSTNQKLIFDAASNVAPISELKLGGNAASLLGEANNELATGASFAATE
jgi:hypothetical protein